ncbi:hypothetical protein NP233_g11458 [Leucocoprinus birnbaumii]|uniref:Transmembrane protein n=1 Tax=Leucocoprinus birnbaumii TaxID=56174 RepID=A0AAD5VMH7_9AGAR|nr:hypothetical protein NP233_g11458 [Leucocoprinus birnbaumii]
MPSDAPSLGDHSDHYRLVPLREQHDTQSTQGKGIHILQPEDSPRHQPQASNTKLKFLIRIGAFIALELGFIALAAVATSDPTTLPLHLSSSISLPEAKGAFTVIAVIWHALAVFAVKEILLHLFSAEWMEQVQRSGELVARETDNVSRMTTGYLDQVAHFGSRRATFQFRVGFVSIVMLLVLNAVGPSAVTVNSVSVQRPIQVEIANLTMTQTIRDEGPPLLATERADMITRLEQLENAVYGFEAVQPNILIPWPSLDPTSNNQTIYYDSDVISYNYSCSWKLPGPNITISSVLIDGGEWFIFYEGLGPSFRLQKLADASESAIVLSKSGSLTYLSLAILPLENSTGTAPLHLAESPLSAFIVAGSNTTLTNAVDLNLEGLPTVLFSGKLDPSLDDPDIDNVLVTTLLCHPNFKLYPARVTVVGGSLQADIQPGPPVVGNIPQEAANAIFSQSLFYATTTLEAWGDTVATANNIARILIFSDPSFESGPDNTTGTKPLSLDRINGQMNKLIRSSSKAYLSGYRPNVDNLTFPGHIMMESNAMGEFPQLVLVGSKPFLIALASVVATLIFLLIIIVATVEIDQLQAFDLEHILKFLHVR